MESTLPPAYYGQAQISRPQSPTSRDASTLHEFSFHRPSGDTIRLLLHSHALKPSNAPVYFDESTISGQVILNLAEGKKQRIKAVSVQIRGYKQVSSNKGHAMDLGSTSFQREFLNIPIKLFPNESGDEALAQGGSYKWPFAAQLPPTFTPEKRNGAAFRLPPTFSISGFPEFFKYEIQVNVQKGLLQSDESLIEQFIYVPRSYPSGSPSAPLQAAYNQGLPVPLPLYDTEGWDIQTATVSGIALDAWAIESTVKLAAPKPFSYTRGSHIPFFVSVTINSMTSTGGSSSFLTDTPIDYGTAEVTIAEVIAQSLRVTLERIYIFGFSAGKPTHEHGVEDIESMPAPDAVKGQAIIHFDQPSALSPVGAETAAHWNPDEKRGPRDTSRGEQWWFQGEVVPKSWAMPSFVFPSLRLSHAITLRVSDRQDAHFHASSASPLPSNAMRKLYGMVGAPPLLSHNIQIVTSHLPGTHSRAAPPAPEYRRDAAEHLRSDSESDSLESLPMPSHLLREDSPRSHDENGKRQ